MTESAAEVGNQVLKQLEDAWNSASGEAFAAPFAEDAEFVNIRAEHHSGRGAIAAGHQAIFGSIYKGSTIEYQTVLAKELADDVLYVLGRGTLNVPSGPMAGEHEARFSVVLSRRDGDWRIEVFHNTMVAPV